MNRTLKINVIKNLKDSNYDAPILILDCINNKLNRVGGIFEKCLKSSSEVDPSGLKAGGVTVIPTKEHPSGRLIVSVMGQLNHDYDDARRLYEAANDGIAKAVKMGLRKPLLMIGGVSSAPTSCKWVEFPYMQRVIMLAALNALYTPLEVYEYAKGPHGTRRNVKEHKADLLGYLHDSDDFPGENIERVAYEAFCIEEGRRVARDIGGSDPERMSPANIASYMQAELLSSKVDVRVDPVDPQEYPLAAAVDRGSSDRQKGRIIKLSYRGGGSIQDNVFLVGKGVTYDTGGHDLKVSGIMAMMHRDKCGAGVVAGIFKVLSLLEPAHVNFTGRMGCIRNSIGPEAYVSDEVITARSGIRVRVNNTDAEGRMVMADLLEEMLGQAVSTEGPVNVFTIATLTGHAMNTYGDSYGALLTNIAGRANQVDTQLQRSGELIGDMFEVSRLRREDWKAHAASDEYADLTNSFAVKGRVHRGHQSPMAFLMLAAAMDKKMETDPEDLSKRLNYTHLDIAGPEVKSCPNPPTAAGLSMMVNQFLLNNK